jgi:hypothetical protein
MAIVSCLPEYKWQSGEMPVCTVNVPVSELSRQLGMRLISWEEEGLGTATGFFCRLQSGEVLLLEELAHAREHLGAKGPTVYMEARALSELGVKQAVAIVLAGLGLPASKLGWVQTEAGLQGSSQSAGKGE